MIAHIARRSSIEKRNLENAFLATFEVAAITFVLYMPILQSVIFMGLAWSVVGLPEPERPLGFL